MKKRPHDHGFELFCRGCAAELGVTATETGLHGRCAGPRCRDRGELRPVVLVARDGRGADGR